MTYDIDAVISATSVVREAINHVGDAFGFPNGWLNADFVKTSSYTPKLIEHSVYYKTYFNILTIRCVAAEYLIAMKLMSGRKYKNDLSDVMESCASMRKKTSPSAWSVLIEQQSRGCSDDYSAPPVSSVRRYVRVFTVSILSYSSRIS